jgi:hypothetical protein
MQPYQPANKAPLPGLLLLTLTALVGGVAIGGIVSFVSRLIYLIILFPIGMGFAGGAAVMVMVKRGKVRFPLVAAAFGALTALLLYGSLHYFDYLAFRSEAQTYLADQLRPDYGEIEPARLQELVDAVLVGEVGQPGFVGYILLEAREGVSIGEVGRDTSVNLGPFFTWVYWLVELGIITFLAVTLPWKAASQPFCETHDRWYSLPRHLGSVGPAQSGNLITLLRSGNFTQAGESLQPSLPLPCVQVHIESCPDCATSDSRLRVEAVALDRRGRRQTRQILKGMLSPFQRADLMRGLAARPDHMPSS